jgi:50S ribosomal protein L16 3-hydroxylase
VAALLAQGVPLLRNPASRYAFIRHETQALTLFVDGQAIDCAGDAAMLAAQLCAEPQMVAGGALAKSAEAVALIEALIDQGSLAFEDEEEEE